jgi:hypothetical protein
MLLYRITCIGCTCEPTKTNAQSTWNDLSVAAFAS